MRWLGSRPPACAFTGRYFVFALALALALMRQSPLSAEELVRFDSAPPLSQQAEENRDGAAIQGYLVKPKGPGPFPAVVLLHSCLGLPSNRQAIAGMIARWGYVALFVDDFATRGIKQTCAVDFPQGLADAFGALLYVAKLPYVDSTRIGAVGYSQGADTALKIAASRAAPAFAIPPDLKFKAAAAFYPPCANEAEATLEIPTLILVGALDDVTPAVDCERLAKSQAERSVRCEARRLSRRRASVRRSRPCRWNAALRNVAEIRSEGSARIEVCAAQFPRNKACAIAIRLAPQIGQAIVLDERPSGFPGCRAILMRRRDFLLGAAAGFAAARPARADVPRAFSANLWPPMAQRAAFIAWMQANRGEDSTFLDQRFDRYQQLLAFNDLWTRADKRAFLMTPREEFVLPQDRTQAYVGHYLDIGFGVSITPPGTMGRMTSAIDVRPGDKVLEIGTGSGYQSALLSYLTDRLWSIEIIPALAARTRRVYDWLIGKGYREYAAHHDAKRGRLLWLGRGGALRQDHRHLRHRPYSAAAAAAIEAGRKSWSFPSARRAHSIF